MLRIFSVFFFTLTCIYSRYSFTEFSCNLVFCSYTNVHRTLICSGKVHKIEYGSACTTLFISCDERNRYLSWHLILNAQQNWNGGRQCRLKTRSHWWVTHYMVSLSLQNTVLTRGQDCFMSQCGCFFPPLKTTYTINYRAMITETDVASRSAGDQMVYYVPHLMSDYSSSMIMPKETMSSWILLFW